MVLDPIPQSLLVHFFGSRPQPPTSRHKFVYGTAREDADSNNADFDAFWLQSSIGDWSPASAWVGVLQCVAVCCSVLQCVAVCCSVSLFGCNHLLVIDLLPVREFHILGVLIIQYPTFLRDLYGFVRVWLSEPTISDSIQYSQLHLECHGSQSLISILLVSFWRNVVKET